MKKLVFEGELFSENEFEDDSFASIENFVESYSKMFFNISVLLLSDFKRLEFLDVVDVGDYDNIKHFTNFIIYYLFNILLNNSAVIQRKKPPYDINIVQKISFKEKKFQLYMFLDDKIFGLCVGTKFKNVLSLIQSIFPLIAKTSFLNEIRFFPISRMEYILGEN